MIETHGHEIGNGLIMERLTEAVRGALELAMAERACVTLMLRGDLLRGVSIRLIEGVVLEIGCGMDGRERVVLGIGEDTRQVVRIDRIARVSRTA